VGKQRISRGVSHASTARRRCPSAPQFGGFPSIYAFTLLHKNRFDVAIHVGRGLVYRGQLCHRLRSWDPSAHQFWGSFLFMRTPFVAELPFLLTWKHMGRRLVFGVSNAPPQWGRIPAFSDLGGSLLFMRTPFVAELSNFTW